MNRQSFKSSNIVSAGYDAESKVIEVEFVGGAIWRYHDVPASVWESLRSAPSVGSFVAKHLKSNYAAERAGVETKPENHEVHTGWPMYIPPFDKIAQVVINGNDFAHAQWLGDADLPLNCSYQFLETVKIEDLPWKMVEILDEPHYQIRWFKRVDA